MEISWRVAIRAAKRVIFLPTEEDEHRTDHSSERIPKQQQKPTDFHREPFARVDAGFFLGRDALKMTGQHDGIATLRTFRRRARIRAQVRERLAAMPASAGENIAAQATAPVASSGPTFKKNEVSLAFGHGGLC